MARRHVARQHDVGVIDDDEWSPVLNSWPTQLGDALQAKADVSKAEAEAEAEASLAKERYRGKGVEATGSVTPADFSITKCVNALSEMEDVNDYVYMKALEKFFIPEWREIFLGMPLQRKRAWLDRLDFSVTPAGFSVTRADFSITSADLSITKCVNALSEMEDVSDYVYMKAVEKFFIPEWREIFLGMPLQRKGAWLDRLDF